MNANSPKYGVGSHSYLARAKTCLVEGSPASLFYAAFELRCCIEARQDEYLEAQKRYRRSLARLWQTGKKAKELDRIFSQDIISKITMTADGAHPITAFHVPINKKLVKNADKLGGYLHAAEEYHSPDDFWWSRFHELLVQTYREAWIACQGKLLCPPLLTPNGTTSVTIEFDHEQDMPPEWREYYSKGKAIVVEVDYPKSAPADWQCDLQL